MDTTGIIYGKSSKNIEWNPISGHIGLILLLIIGTIFIGSLLLLVYRYIVIVIFVLCWLVFFCIIIYWQIRTSLSESWRFERKAYKLEPARLLIEIEKMLDEEKMKYEKMVVKSKIAMGFEKTFFDLKAYDVRIALRTTNQFIHIGPIIDKNRDHVEMLKQKIDKRLKSYIYTQDDLLDY